MTFAYTYLAVLALLAAFTWRQTTRFYRRDRGMPHQPIQKLPQPRKS